MTIKHKRTGKIYTINYVRVDIEPSFEKQVKRPKVGGWSSPMRGACSCRGK